MAKKVEISVEEKLRALFDLQLIDSRIDQIRSIRGELPLEVEDLENEIEGLNSRLESFENEIKESVDGIKFEENSISTSKENHKKYEGDLKKVRNNREYNAIVKEQEFQELEIKLSEKKIAQYKEIIENKTVVLEELKDKIKDRKSHLKAKNSELGEILKETEKEEKALMADSAKAEKVIDDRLLGAYKRIRSKVANGMAVVSVDRNACGGCFSEIPPQRQLDIQMHKKVIACEHCGRIMIDANIFEEQEA